MIAGRCAAEVAAQAVLAVWNDVSLRATRQLVTWRHLQSHSPGSQLIQPAPKCNGHPSIDWCIVWEPARRRRECSLADERSEDIHMSAMNSASIRVNESRSSAGPRASPTVFVVDDDESVRESLELLISSAGWKPELFASAPEFLSRPPLLSRTCLVLDVTLLVSPVWIYKVGSLATERTCQSSLSRVMATYLRRSGPWKQEPSNF